MIVGAGTLADLALPLRSLEGQLGRSVTPTLYTKIDFLKRVNEKNHFLTSVLKTELLFLIGAADDLARLVKSANPQVHKTSQREMSDLRAVVKRDLADAKIEGPL